MSGVTEKYDFINTFLSLSLWYMVDILTFLLSSWTNKVNWDKGHILICFNCIQFANYGYLSNLNNNYLNNCYYKLTFKVRQWSMVKPV